MLLKTITAIQMMALQRMVFPRTCSYSKSVNVRILSKVASLLVEKFSSNFWHISVFFFLSLSQERITSLTANFVEFRGRDGILLGAHCICPMQISLFSNANVASLLVE